MTTNQGVACSNHAGCTTKWEGCLNRQPFSILIIILFSAKQPFLGLVLIAKGRADDTAIYGYQLAELTSVKVRRVAIKVGDLDTGKIQVSHPDRRIICFRGRKALGRLMFHKHFLITGRSTLVSDHTEHINYHIPVIFVGIEKGVYITFTELNGQRVFVGDTPQVRVKNIGQLIIS